jgi:hypothetical protein
VRYIYDCITGKNYDFLFPILNPLSLKITLNIDINIKYMIKNSCRNACSQHIYIKILIDFISDSILKVRTNNLIEIMMHDCMQARLKLKMMMEVKFSFQEQDDYCAR